MRQAFDRARRGAGMPGFRFHDLRHTGGDRTTTKDLMRRLGHASPAPSYRYLHAIDGRDEEIASRCQTWRCTGDASKLPRSIVTKH
jgi:integrase